MKIILILLILNAFNFFINAQEIKDTISDNNIIDFKNYKDDVVFSNSFFFNSFKEKMDDHIENVNTLLLNVKEIPEMIINLELTNEISQSLYDFLYSLSIISANISPNPDYEYDEEGYVITMTQPTIIHNIIYMPYRLLYHPNYETYLLIAYDKGYGGNSFIVLNIKKNKLKSYFKVYNKTVEPLILNHNQQLIVSKNGVVEVTSTTLDYREHLSKENYEKLKGQGNIKNRKMYYTRFIINDGGYLEFLEE